MSFSFDGLWDVVFSQDLYGKYILGLNNMWGRRGMVNRYFGENFWVGLSGGRLVGGSGVRCMG